MQDSPNLK